jgi:hypothetical protein
MAGHAVAAERFFKTAWFTKAAKKAKIPDSELCAAIRQVMLGQADDLGGGVYKKRLSKNLYRSIILAKGGQFWVYEFLFAKQNLANIPDTKLMELRQLARTYAKLTTSQVRQLLLNNDWMEICHDYEA